MAEVRQLIAQRIVGILNDRGFPRSVTDLDDGEALYGPTGCGLDSLDLAVLSTLLERDWGRDPFSRGIFPRTVGELVAFYEQPA